MNYETINKELIGQFGTDKYVWNVHLRTGFTMELVPATKYTRLEKGGNGISVRDNHKYPVNTIQLPFIHNDIRLGPKHAGALVRDEQNFA